MARKVFSSSSRPYSLASSVLNSAEIIRKEGVGMARTLHRLQFASPSEPVALRFSRLNHPFFVRPGTDDIITVISNVIREEYGHFQMNEPRWLIDGGAYIGDSSAYFLSRFPTLKAVSLEPDPKSYEQALLNLKPYGTRATVLHNGLQGQSGNRLFSGNTIRFNTGEREGGQSVACLDIPSIMEAYDIPVVDILKLDIEGSELDVFQQNPGEWMGKVKLLIVETHGDEHYQALKQAVDKNGFSMRRYRSLWYCQRVNT